MTGILKIVTGFLLVLVLIRLGMAIVRILVRDRGNWAHAGSYFPVGFGVATYSAFLISWAGFPLTFWSVFGLLVVLLTASTATEMWVTSSRFRPNKRPGPRLVDIPPPLWALVLLAGIVILSGILAVGRSYSTWDAMAA